MPIRSVCLLVLLSLLGSSHADAQQEDASVTVPEGKEAVEDIGLKVGDVAPKFALMSSTGEYEILSKWTGKRLARPASQPIRHVVVVSFFATWCKPCMKELPHLQRLYEKYQGKDVKFFLIDITEATRKVEGYENSLEAITFLKERGITIPILNDVYGMAKKSYGATTLPRLYVVDKYKTIQYAAKGFKEEEKFEDQLSAVIDRLLLEE